MALQLWICITATMFDANKKNNLIASEGFNLIIGLGVSICLVSLIRIAIFPCRDAPRACIHFCFRS